MRRFLPLVLLPVLLSGCVTNTITNLTPSALPRNDDGLYAIEMAWDSNQQTIRKTSLTPYVVLGFEMFEMRPTLGMGDRWESFIPVPATESAITYHFKVDWEENQMGGQPGKGSKLSRVYKLEILDEE